MKHRLLCLAQVYGAVYVLISVVFSIAVVFIDSPVRQRNVCRKKTKTDFTIRTIKQMMWHDMGCGMPSEGTLNNP